MIYPEQFHTDDVSHPLLIWYNYNNMHAKPNKMKGVDRLVTNITSAWHVCYDLLFTQFQLVGFHSLSLTSMSFKDLNLFYVLEGWFIIVLSKERL